MVAQTNITYYNIGRKKILRGRVQFPTGGKVRELIIRRISGQKSVDKDM